MSEIQLNGKPPGAGNQERISCVVALLTNASIKVNHIDGLRQKNITIALVIFAGLFGFALKSPGKVNAWFYSVALTVMMLVFCVMDRRLHKISHGWGRTWWTLAKQLGETINSPEKDVAVPRYCVEAEKNAEWRSLQPIIYYLLIGAAILSFWVFPWAS
jgi:hypothetical protein